MKKTTNPSIDDIMIFSRNYFQYLNEVLSKISFNELSKFVEVLLDAQQRGSTIYFIGNGGSAATASHFANDIAIGIRNKQPFKAVSLCDNQAVMTAIANDDGYGKVFSRQLEVLLKDGDVIVAISASGNSPNLLKAIEISKLKNTTTVGLTAFDGGKLSNVVDINIHVPTSQGEYGPAEDAHMILDHLISNYLTQLLEED